MPGGIVHLDADAFFASVEQAADSRLRGRPVAVGGEKRGIIASASYEARKFGIYTPMPTVLARRLCPKLILLPGDFEKYERFSRWMFSYAYDFTPDVEVASIDEGYFDLKGVRRPPVEVAQVIREAIRQALKISVSEGIAANKLVSQVASKLNKPAAFLEVPAGREAGFLAPLPNRWLPGVGPKLADRLNAAGLARIAQVAATPLDLLEALVGGGAPALSRFARGLDDRPVVPAREPAKSFGQQETFAADVADEEYVAATLLRMADHLFAKVRAEGKSIRTLTVKVRYNDMAEDQCAESLAEPTNVETEVYGRVRSLLQRAWKRRVSLRLVSLKLSNLYDGRFSGELALEAGDGKAEDRRRLAQAVDLLREKYGRMALLRGHDFQLREAPGAGPGRGTAGKSAPCVSGGSQNPRRKSSVRMALQLTPIPLAVRSYYSFLNSTLAIADIVALARRHELPAIGLADLGNLHGAPEFARQAREAGLQPLVGAEVRVEGRPLLLYVENRRGYANLCRLLSDKSEIRNPKLETNSNDQKEENLEAGAFSVAGGAIDIEFARLAKFAEGLVAIGRDSRLAGLFPGRFYQAVYSPEEAERWATEAKVPGVAVLPAHYATPAERWKFDVVQSIRTRTLLKQSHPDKWTGGDHHFRGPAEMRALFGRHPRLMEGTRDVAERCRGFEFPFGKPQFPAYAPLDGATPGVFFRRLVMEGLRRRYPDRWQKVLPQIEEELAIIAEVGYEDYFLVVWDLLQECRRRGIEWLTRGSAADSLVCYCLEISSVCPIRFDLYFRRFLNRERMALNKLPDIDVDFAHDRRDDVVALLFEKYGPEHCAVVGGFSTYQARGAVGDVGKVLGLSEHQVRRFTEHFPWGRAKNLLQLLRENQECRDLPLHEEPYRSALQMAEFLDGFPRYPKMHPCGVVLSRQPMGELTPVFRAPKGWLVTHYDMDAVEAIGLVKIDVLAQGGLAVMRDVRSALAARGLEVDWEKFAVKPGHAIRAASNGLVFAGKAIVPSAVSFPLTPSLSLGEREGFSAVLGTNASTSGLDRNSPNQMASANSPLDPWTDPAVWEMIANGGSRAVHHLESPAMIGLCRQCNVREMDGLVGIVSVIRPGAANEQKKRRFIRRYQGMEPVEYPHPSLEACLKGTFGLVVYEEHVLQICEAFAGLPAGKADLLRRALGKEKVETIREIGGEFYAAARRRGRSEETIAEVWKLVLGFAGYAFCKAHSAAYAVEAYQSAWLKRYFPVEFMAAVLSNGKGFYDPLVYVLECHRLGLRMLPPWVNEPGPAFLPKPDLGAIRVPVARIKGLTRAVLERLLAERARGEFVSLRDFCLRVAPTPEEMDLLIRAGALDGFGLSRTRQFWEARLLRRAGALEAATGQGWLIPPPGAERLAQAPLEEPSRQQRLEWEAELLGFTASGHPLELFGHIAWDTYCPVSRLGEFLGQEVVTCGLVIEQRLFHQVTGEPMKFLTLADWTGIVETELFAPTYRRHGLATVRYPVLEIAATVEPFENGRGFTLRVQRAGQPREWDAIRHQPGDHAGHTRRQSQLTAQSPGGNTQSVTVREVLPLPPWGERAG